MPRTRFHTLLEDRIQKARDLKATDLANASAKDYAEYKYWCGYVVGLGDALKIADQIVQEEEGDSGA